jgi:hypothetical protein
MSYVVCDISGYVGDLASNGGLDDLWKYLSGRGVDDLIDDGTVDLSEDFLTRLKAIPDPPDEDVRSTLENLRRLVEECEHILIVSDSLVLTSGEEEDSPPKSRKFLTPREEAIAALHWRGVDKRRSRWWDAAASKIQGLYAEEKSRVLKVITEENKFRLDQVIEDSIRSLRPDWEKTLTAVLVSVVDDFGKTAMDNFNTAKSVAGREVKQGWDPWSDASQKWIAEHGAESVKTIIDSDLDDVRDILLTFSTEEATVYELGDSIREFYDDKSAFKSMRVARTEVGAAAGFGQHEAAVQSNVQAKRWVSSRDDRVRDKHVIMDTEEQVLDWPYSNGLMYPGDTSGDLDEFIQCRCAEQYFFRDPVDTTEHPVWATGDVPAGTVQTYRRIESELPVVSQRGIKEVEIHSGGSYDFQAGGTTFRSGGDFSSYGKMNIFDAANASEGDLKWITSHEAGHAVYNSSIRTVGSDLMAQFKEATISEGGVTDYSRKWLVESQMAGINENFAEFHRIFDSKWDIDRIDAQKGNPESFEVFSKIWKRLGGK